MIFTLVNLIIISPVRLSISDRWAYRLTNWLSYLVRSIKRPPSIFGLGLNFMWLRPKFSIVNFISSFIVLTFGVLCQVCVRKVLTFSSVYKESVNFTTFFYFLKKK